MTFAPSSRDGLLCCEVGRARFAFRSADVRHVERAEYMRPDRDDHGRIGMLRLGGQQVPVFALGNVLGTTRDEARPPGSEGHIAVTGDRNALTGWLVDRIARAAQPSPGDIAALPPITGPQAASWFEGLVWLGDDESALLLAPHHLNATAAPATLRDGISAFTPPRSIAAAEPEPVAIVFSTTALPAWDVRRYALSGRQIAAIIQPTAPITVPGCHDHVEGVTWWRRSAVPVVDFRARSERHGTAPGRRLIAHCGSGSLVAFSVEPEVMMCRPTPDHRFLPAVTCPPFASGVFDVNGEAVALLDLEALLMQGHRQTA